MEAESGSTCNRDLSRGLSLLASTPREELQPMDAGESWDGIDLKSNLLHMTVQGSCRSVIFPRLEGVSTQEKSLWQ